MRRPEVFRPLGLRDRTALAMKGDAVIGKKPGRQEAAKEIS
jgi:hypothetical protein